MAPRLYSLQLLLMLISHVRSEVSFYQVPQYTNANMCVQTCFAGAVGAQYVSLCGFANFASGYANCLCNTENGNSDAFRSSVSQAVLLSQCKNGEKDATSAMGIFSAYCSWNKVGAVINSASATQAATNNPTAQASTGATPTGIETKATSTPSDSSNTNTSSSSDSKGLSTSDKITIGCAIGGAIVAILIAIATWRCMRSNGNNNNNTHEVQPLQNVQPMTGPVYHNPQQQPFLTHQYPPPYQQQQPGWGRPNWR